MFIIDVVPLTKIPIQAPQVLSYFYQQKLNPGAMVLIPVSGRRVNAIVTHCSSVQERKLELKRKSFKLKKISRVISSTPVITKLQIKLANWFHRYYLCSLGATLQLFLPQALINKKKPVSIPRSKIQTKKRDPKTTLLWQSKREDFYFNQIKKTLRGKEQVLFLVPQIQTIEKIKNKIKKRFSKTPNISVSHSRLRSSERFEQWNKIRTGRTDIVIGTRSAVFSPHSNLGLIIIDEEENPSYKSWQQHPRYHAKTVASKIADLRKAKLILGSSLPSVESYYLTKKKKYKLEDLKSDISYLKSNLVDMREESKEENYSIFSNALEEKLIRNLNQDKKSILFINRRGAATSLFCRDCGYLVKCKNCDVPLVYHRKSKNQKTKKGNYLLCHHCGYQTKAPSVCPNCGGSRIKYFGVGTQKVIQELKKKLSQAKISRLDSDIAPTLPKQKKILEEFLNRGDILVGTELLLKFKNLKLNFAAVVLIDPPLNFPEFRAQERVFQTIHHLKQLAQQVLIQTYNPELSFFDHLEKPEQFLDRELEQRKQLSYPPWSELIKLSFAHSDNNQAKRELKKLKQYLNSSNLKSEIEILGPAPAFIPKVKKKYIWHLVIKCKSKKLSGAGGRPKQVPSEPASSDLKSNLRQLIPTGVKVDVDPIQIL